MKQLKIVKNMYIVMDVCLIIVGLLILFSPIKAINVLCRIFGVVLVLLGAVKILGYFTKDIFQLAFCTWYHICNLRGCAYIQNLIHGGNSICVCGNSYSN